MSYIKVNINSVIGLGSIADRSMGSVRSARDGVNSVINRVDGRIKSRSNAVHILASLNERLNNVERRISQLRTTVENGANRYRSTENMLEGTSQAIAANSRIVSGAAGGIVSLNNRKMLK